MKMIKHQNCIAVFVFLAIFYERIGLSATQLCHFDLDTNLIFSNLNMDSSPISGSGGMCSCRIYVHYDARLLMIPDMIIPGCSTMVSLSDTSHKFVCSNERIILPTIYRREMKAGDELWIFVTSTGVSLPMSGLLQIQTPMSSQFTLECFDANTNTSATRKPSLTTISSSTTTTTTTTTSFIATNSTTNNSGTTSTATPLGTQTNGTASLVTTLRQKAHFTSSDATAATAGGIIGGIAVLVIIVIGAVIFHRRYRCIRRTESDQIPESRDHPTYRDLTNRENTEYEHIDHDNDRVYQNVTVDMTS